MPNKDNLPNGFRVENQDLAKDLQDALLLDPGNQEALSMLEQIKALQALPQIQVSADFEQNLKQRLAELAPRKRPIWLRPPIWSVGAAAVFVMCLLNLRPVPEQPPAFQAELLQIQSNPFESELLQTKSDSVIRIQDAEFALNPESLNYPRHQVHVQPQLKL